MWPFKKKPQPEQVEAESAPADAAMPDTSAEPAGVPDAEPERGLGDGDGDEG